jgi:nucleotidyltransferase/DNA polymerase involved in DNA repair
VFDPTRRQRPLLEAPDGRVGLTLREAESRWPDVAYRADAPAEYAQAIAPVLDVLAELSPTVEWSMAPADASAAARHGPTARYAIFLDGTGLVTLYGSEARLAKLIAREVPERTGHRVRVGIADGRYAALLAATVPGLPAIVAPGTDAAFLAPLPVSHLPLLPEARERVARLGARTLADFVRLPSNALRHRFGPDGLVAKALALGRDEGPLRPRPVPLQFHDTIDLEWVETSLDRLQFLLKRLADRLSVRLAHHGLGCGRLRVSWLLDRSGLTTGDDVEEEAPPPGPLSIAMERGSQISPAPPLHRNGEGAGGWGLSVVSTVRLAEPAGSSTSLLEHLRWHVEGLRPETFRDPVTGQPCGVRGIVVEAEELAPLGGRQLNLLPGEDGRAPSPERLLAAERALARLQARWGESAVQQAELVASRRPERAFRWREGGLALQISGATPGKSLSRAVRTPRPSVRAPVRKRSETSAPKRAPVTEAARPFWLSGPLEDVEVDRGGRLPNGRRRPGAVVQGDRVRRILRAAGPWRLVERWAAEPVSRDAYHVVLADGTACWLIHDRLEGPDGRWRIVGTFD